MNRILASITTLDQHLEALRLSPDVYRPEACPHCGVSGLWGHGCYYRKGDRSTGGATREPVPVPRYLCPGCIGTCSRLPLFMSPRRWYCWAMQQLVLLLLLSGSVIERLLRPHRSCAANGGALEGLAQAAWPELCLLPAQPISRVGTNRRTPGILAPRDRQHVAGPGHGLARPRADRPVMPRT